MADSKAFWAFLGVAGMWGSSFLFIKLGLSELTPFTLVAYRTGFATLALAAILSFQTHNLPKDRRTLALLFVAGILNPAVPYLLITWGQQYVTSANAGIINGTVPLFTLPLAHFLLRDERITPIRLAGLGIGFIGVLLIFGREQPFPLLEANSSTGLHADRVLLGQLAMIGAAICYAGSIVFVRHSLRETAPEVVAGASQGVALILTTLGALALEAPFSSRMSISGWMVVAWLGISSGISYLLFYYVLGEWGTTRTSLVTYLVPVIAVLLGILVLSEVVVWQAFAGGVLVICGIIMINRQARTKSGHSAQ
jgi:drug/metabolite transporter (DMT)-like permease